MNFLYITALLSWQVFTALYSQPFTLVSWNIQDFGKTKDDLVIKEIASIVKNADLVAIQEVVAIDPGGAQAVARLADELNRTGSKWDYRISDPTDSPPYKTERYAFLWKASRVQLLGRPWLEKGLPETVYREPFMARFRCGGKTLLVANFHSRRYDENPGEEIIQLAKLPKLYPSDIILIAGDFNANETNSAFKDMTSQGYEPSLQNQLTTLRRTCESGYLANAIDNIYFPTKSINKHRAYSQDFVGSCEHLEEARRLSDHLPVALVFSFR